MKYKQDTYNPALVLYLNGRGVKNSKNCAVLFHWIQYYTTYNRAYKIQSAKKEGVYWTYHTYNKLADHFTTSEKVIIAAVNALKKEELIIVGSFFVGKTKPNWYRPTDKSKEFQLKLGKDGKGGLRLVAEKDKSGIPLGSSTTTPKGVEVDPLKGDLYKDKKEEREKDSVLEDGSAQPTSLFDLLDKSPDNPDSVEVVKSIGSQVNDLMNAFIDLSISPKAMHQDFAQRAEAKKLIEKFGLDACLERLYAVPIMNKTAYAPSVHNVFQLHQKWHQMEDYVHRERSRSNQKGTQARIY